MPRNVRANAHLWAFVILPRLKVYAGVWLLHLLTRERP